MRDIYIYIYIGARSSDLIIGGRARHCSPVAASRELAESAPELRLRTGKGAPAPGRVGGRAAAASPCALATRPAGELVRGDGGPRGLRGSRARAPPAPPPPCGSSSLDEPAAAARAPSSAPSAVGARPESSETARCETCSGSTAKLRARAIVCSAPAVVAPAAAAPSAGARAEVEEESGWNLLRMKERKRAAYLSGETTEMPWGAWTRARARTHGGAGGGAAA